MSRSKTGEALSSKRRTSRARKALMRFVERADKRGDLDEWRRGRAVTGYIEGKRVVELAETLGVTRSAINKWLIRYEAEGIPGLRTVNPPGLAPKLSAEQQKDLAVLVEAGPMVAGYASGVWTGPMIADLIEGVFGIRFHNHSVPRLLHKIGFSVQRPRKRLARADAAQQAYWRRRKFPAIKKKPPPAEAS